VLRYRDGDAKLGKPHNNGKCRKPPNTFSFASLTTSVWGSASSNMGPGDSPMSSPHCSTSAALASMLEKEQSSPYQRCSPNEVIPLAEYTQDRKLLIEWCTGWVRMNFKSSNELVEVTMALADKYMSSPNIHAYIKAHYQVVVVTCLGIAIKLASMAKSLTSKDLSDLCRGAYTTKEIESEEMSVIQALSWYLNPPTASQIVNHVLALAKKSSGAVNNNWKKFVSRVHQIIYSTVLDMGLSTTQRPSTVAMAALLVSIGEIQDQHDRQAILRSTVSVLTMYSFDSPWEVDSLQINIHNSTEASVHQLPPSPPAILAKSPKSISHLGKDDESTATEDTPAPFDHDYCIVISQSQSSPCQVATRRGKQANTPSRRIYTSRRRRHSTSMELENGSSSSTKVRAPRKRKNKRERRSFRRMTSHQSHSSCATLDSIPEHIEFDGESGELDSVSVSTLTLV